MELRYFYGLSMETWRSGVSQPQALNLKDLEPGTNIELSLRQFERRLCERWCGQGGGNRLAQEFGEQRADRGTVAGYERGNGWPESRTGGCGPGRKAACGVRSDARTRPHPRS